MYSEGWNIYWEGVAVSPQRMRVSNEGPDTSKNPVRDFEIPDFRIGFRISKQDFGFHFFDKECENRR